jgi:hypothetical protein
MLVRARIRQTSPACIISPIHAPNAPRGGGRRAAARRTARHHRQDIFLDEDSRFHWVAVGGEESAIAAAPPMPKALSIWKRCGAFCGSGMTGRCCWRSDQSSTMQGRRGLRWGRHSAGLRPALVISGSSQGRQHGCTRPGQAAWLHAPKAGRPKAGNMPALLRSRTRLAAGLNH